MTDLDILKDIPRYPEWSKIDFVNKGWSSDEKFCITDKRGSKLLLRVSGIDEYEKKKMEFERTKIISSLGINMTIPIEFGVLTDNQKVYSLLSWIEGEDAEAILPKLNEHIQYELGIKAGEQLKKIHTIAAPTDLEPWGQRYKRKIKWVVEQYKNCSLSIPSEEKVISFIESNMPYLDNRPQTIQHGDYHVGNLIITPNNEIGVIDFNRSSFGDPWEEYDRYIFTWQTSTPFAIGQIHGYFDNIVPDEFFRLLSLYNATNMLAAIPWAVPYGEAEVDVMLENAKKLFDSYSGFERHVPVWYRDV